MLYTYPWDRRFAVFCLRKRGKLLERKWVGKLKEDSVIVGKSKGKKKGGGNIGRVG